MDEQQAMAITARCLRDRRPMMVNIDVQSAWLLVSALQLSTRHPMLSMAMGSELTRIARQFQGEIAALHPEANELLEMGWNPVNDLPAADRSSSG